MKKIIILSISCVQLVFAQVNSNIGGNNSFNHNIGNINITQSNYISNEENILNQNIENYQPADNYGKMIKILALDVNKIKKRKKEKM